MADLSERSAQPLASEPSNGEPGAEKLGSTVDAHTVANEYALALFLDGELVRIKMLVDVWRDCLSAGRHEESAVAWADAESRLTQIEGSIDYLHHRMRIHRAQRPI